MIDRFFLSNGEEYTFLTDNQFVVVVSIGDGLEVYKDSDKLASLSFLEDYSAPANTGKYTLKATQDISVLLVRYILV